MVNIGSSDGGFADLNDISIATVFNAPTAFGCSKTGRSCADVKKEMQK